MTIWTPRNLGIIGAGLSAAGLIIGGSLWADMLTHRASIQSSAEATCTDPSKDCAQKDLPAQVRAATAAEAMADLTFLQSILGALGVVIGGATLLAAARAAHWAKEAAEHTRRSADSADRMAGEAIRNSVAVEAANGLSQILAAHQSRAYVGVQPNGEISLGAGERVFVNLSLENHGTTPALNFAVSSRVMLRAVDWIDEQEPGEPDGPRPSQTLFPRQSFQFTSESTPREETLTAAQIAAIHNGQAILLIRGLVVYDDVFGQPHTTRFAFELGAEDIQTGHIRVSSSGNTAS